MKNSNENLFAAAVVKNASDSMLAWDGDKVSAEETASNMVSELRDFVDSMYWVGGISHVFRAFTFYMNNSTDNEHQKEEAQKAFERLVSNDEAYKRCSQELNIIVNSLEDSIGMKQYEEN